MKQFILIIAIAFVSFTSTAQNVFGKWKTIDDVSGEAKSIIDIYERDGKVYGKVTQILTEGREDSVCTECDGEDKGKPILGLEIIRGLEKDGDVYEDGEILDPENGKRYKCYIELVENNKLKVRGYIGFSLLGRTQYWYRVK
ncbi:MAG: hypothetical protein ACI825_000959 [Planctomycetota bacterium]|jgi:uncharacterized protein (DUF2147 family)|uniref:DUF2147 domain-containing protein n=1 Tax=Patiriisocius sp. Uisw_047 TaxID=3230969 RepID=UPI0039E8944A